MEQNKLNTKEEFSALVEEIQSQTNYRAPLGFGVCRIQYGQVNSDKMIAAAYPVINWGDNFGSAALLMKVAGLVEPGQNQPSGTVIVDLTVDMVVNMHKLFTPYMEEAVGVAHKNVQVVKWLRSHFPMMTPENQKNYKLVFVFEDKPITSLPEAYLKLGALSACKAKPNTLNLEGIFGVLTTVGWKDGEAFELEYLEQEQVADMLSYAVQGVDYVDKFPRYLDLVLPQPGTRILDSSRVRYGAYIGKNCTIMPGASYVNFNAGAADNVMIEGRISSSAFVNTKSDIGGGASMLGVLSGGNSTPIYMGEGCLLGANSVLGVPFGDGCTLAAGESFMPGSKVFISTAEFEKIKAVNKKMPEVEGSDWVGGGCCLKGKQLAGLNALQLLPNTTRFEANLELRFNPKIIELNPELHG